MVELDWDSIREAEGLKIGDQVRARGQEVGVIRNLIKTKNGLRARVQWPTIPFECEGQLSTTGAGSESFVDLNKLRLANGQLALL